MYSLERDLVPSEFTHKIIINHIILFIILCLDYHANLLDGEWVHGTCKGKEVCYGRILVDGRNGRLLRNQNSSDTLA